MWRPGPGTAALVALGLFLGGCAAGKGAQDGSALPPAPNRLFTLGVDLPEDHRDFSRMDFFAPEMRSFFDRSRDAYGIDGSLNPFTLEFTSGSTFHWDMTVPELVREALLRETSRNDLFSWVRPMPTSEMPRFILHVSVGEFHYQRADRVFYPQVSMEALVLEGRTREVLYKVPARVRDEFGVADQTGTLNNHVFRVEDWLERDLRDQMNRALEKACEKLGMRLDGEFFQVEAQKALRPGSPPPGGAPGGAEGR